MLWDDPGTWGLFLAPPELSDVLPVLTHPYQLGNPHFGGISVSGTVTSALKATSVSR